MTAVVEFPTRLMLTGSWTGGLFSVPWQAEGRCQVEGSFVNPQATVGSPKVKGIALGLAVRVEAVEDVFAQMHR
jgi:hypothetical protein